MADRHAAHLLIGGGIASATAAATLRAEGATGSVLLVGRELDAPYHRPPATKEYLRGSASKADALVHPAGWWAENDVELLTRTSVTALDPEARTATLSTKETVSYDTALLATGAMVRRLSLPGTELDGLHYVRALMNADMLKRDLASAEARHVVLVGGSYIGCELAASLTEMGFRCTVLMLEEEPMERGFGPRVGRHVRALLEAHGVTVRGGVDVEGFAGAERIERVLLAGGEELAADAVVAGVGATPDVMTARKAGLALGDLGGVACDAGLKTSADGLWAAGDMCEYESVLHGRTTRIEHEDLAAKQGAHVARAMLGSTAPFAEVPYFWTDLADWSSFEHVGAAKDWASEELDGTPGSGPFGVRYLDEQGRLVAALSADGGGDLDAARAELAARVPA
ncbi:MAG: oxidoreductase [Solirubrobacterales bacterium]|jgi:3-phenylpropionate/trans-cinnamate dioxygenase ferredoxin reductase subunit|nr:oxidoreductase [Solirubrobacterales bacterium]